MHTPSSKQNTAAYNMTLSQKCAGVTDPGSANRQCILDFIEEQRAKRYRWLSMQMGSE